MDKSMMPNADSTYELPQGGIAGLGAVLLRAAERIGTVTFSGLISTSSFQNGTPMIGSTIFMLLSRCSRSLASCVAPSMLESVE